MNNRITMYIAIAILAIGLLQCKKEEDPSPPTISVITPAESNPIAYPGKFMQLKLNATADANNGADLSNITVKRQFEDADATIPVDNSISGSEYTLEETIQVADLEGTEIWTITVTDNKGQNVVKIITISIQGDAPNLAPTLAFSGENNDFEIDINTSFVFGVVANSNTDSGVELSKFSLKKKVGNTNPVSVFPEKEISGVVFVWDSTFFSNYQPAVETYIFKITDINGEFVEKSIKVTTEQADPGIFIFNGNHVGSFESTIGAGFSCTTGEVYDIAAVTVDQQSEVDFVFFRDDGYGYTFMSPQYPVISNVYQEINNWDTKKITKFEKTTLSVSMYNSIEIKNQLTTAIYVQAGITEFTEKFFSENISNPGGFAVNDVIAFECQGGTQQGLMLIKEIEEGNSVGQSTVIFDMKVEKP